MHESTRHILSRNLRHLRLLRGWSQEQLAESSGMHRTYIGAIERGERNPCLDNLERLALALGVSASRLLNDTVQADDPPGIAETCLVYAVSDFTRPTQFL